MLTRKFSLLLTRFGSIIENKNAVMIVYSMQQTILSPTIPKGAKL